MVNISAEIESHLTKELLDLIRKAGSLASETENNLYLVGGTVRDLFLGRPSLDIDLALEGDAPSFARKLAKIKGFKIVSHPHFGTATVSRDVTSIDIVTARSETYLRPGALPTVKPGAIQDDLYRRDFTINAMAVYITPNRFGEVVDPYGGRIDIDNGVIRVLHDGSFTDDPTRIWRAIRYEQRLGFTLELETEELLRRDIPLMDRISGDRLRHELEGILLEDYPEKTICRADDLGVLKNLLPQLNGDNWLRGRFEKARKINPDSRIEHTLYYAVMSWRLGKEYIEAFIERLKFGREVSKSLRDIPRLKGIIGQLQAEVLKPSGIFHLLKPYHQQTVTAALIAEENKRLQARISLYLSDLRFVKPALNGEDLVAMGVPQGKNLGRLLGVIRDARLNGEAKTRKEEQDLVNRWLAKSKYRS